MDATIDYGRDGGEQVLVSFPLGAGRLLVHIHAHHQWLAPRVRDLDRFLPGRMVAEDVTRDQLQILCLR